MESEGTSNGVCMNSGYLYVELVNQSPETYHLAMSLERPEPEQLPNGQPLVYVARFRDIDAAFMHAGGKLRRRCKHPDTVTFVTELSVIIATIEADGLKHERIWLTDTLNDKEMDAIATETQRLQNKAQNQELVWKMVGIIAVVIFVLLSVAV